MVSARQGWNAQWKFDRMFMTTKEVQDELKLSPDSVDRRHSQGRMPRAVPLPGRRRCWLRQEILDWKKADCPSRSDWEDRHQGQFPRDRALRAIMPARGQAGPVSGPEFLDRGQLAQLIRVNLRSVDYMNQQGRIPPPVPGPGRPRWDFRGVLDWIEHGCPAREHDQVDRGNCPGGPLGPNIPGFATTTSGSAPGVPPFPIENFPAPLRDFATGAALSIRCPIDLVALPMLAAAATAIGASRVIGATPDWREGPRLYLAAVAPPGAGKTPAHRHVFGPIERLEARFRREADQGMQPDDSKHGRPAARRLIVADVTVEGLIPLLRDHPRGLILLIDELSGWRASFNRYRGGRGNDRQFFLSCFSGQSLRIDRKATGPVFVPNPTLNVYGTIQPDLLPQLADKGGRADGFLDRILFAFPEPVAGRRWPKRGIPDPAVAAWDRVIDRLATLSMEPDPDGGVDRPHVLGFTPEAEQAWIAWYDAHAAESEDPDLGESLQGVWIKLETYALRLLLIVQLLRFACDEASDTEIDAESVGRGILMVDYFKAHARRVHDGLAEQPADRRAELARRWIETHGGEATARELQRKNVAGICRATEANTMLRNLVDRGFGRIESRKAGNGQRVDRFVLGSP